MNRWLYKIKSGKNVKLFYYVANYCRLLVPSCLYRMRLQGRLKACSRRSDYAEMRGRADYCCRLESVTELPAEATTVAALRRGETPSTYFFDTRLVTRWFGRGVRIVCAWGDVTSIPPVPSLVKSRPIEGDNANSVLLKLDRIRHFTWVSDHRTWEEKNDLIVFRGKIHSKEKRQRFFEMYFGNPRFNLGDTSRHGCEEWKTGKMTIDEQLQYKFILALEGNDVASNLKWVMSSNSAAVMPRPEYETWFLEGRLIPNYHYIEVKRDFSDVEERIDYYIAHPEEAKAIVRHAQEYVKQFQDERRETLIQLMVMDRYVKMTR